MFYLTKQFLNFSTMLNTRICLIQNNLTVDVSEFLKFLKIFSKFSKNLLNFLKVLKNF